MPRGVAISEQKFSDIKLLISSGFSFQKTADITCVSTNTVRKVDNAANFKAYIGEEEKTEPNRDNSTTMVSYHQLKALTEGVERMNQVLDEIFNLLHKYMEVPEPKEEQKQEGGVA